MDSELYFTLINARGFIHKTAQEYERLEQRAIESGTYEYVAENWARKKDDAYDELAKLDTFISNQLQIPKETVD